MNDRYIISVLVFLLFAGRIIAQNIAPGYEVGVWQNFRSAAVTHTFDDNDLNQLAVAVLMFNEFNFKLTLFAITDATSGWRSPNWPGLAEAATQGHEIASHTITHPRLNELSIEQQTTELKNSHDTINENITGQSALTLAYPYCVLSNASLTTQYYIAARGCQGSVERSTPLDMMNISSIICGSEGSVRTAANFNSRVDAAVNSKGWCVFLIHGIDSDGGWSPVSSGEIRGHLEYLHANDNKFWVDTFGNVVRYIRERNAASVSEISAEENSITVQLTDGLDDAIYNYPITIRRVLPQDWPSASAAQNGESISAKIVEINSEKYVMFDAIPDGGDIVLTKSNATGIRLVEAAAPEQPFLMKNYPNPFNPSTTIVYNVTETGQVKLEIYNVLGEKLETLVNEIKQPGRYTVQWDASNYTSGIYIYKYEVDNKVFSERMAFIK